MTADLIAEARKVLENVTPGPWSYDGEPWNLIVWDGNGNRVCFNAHSNGLDDTRDIATARFISWSREGVPALLTHIAAQDARIKRLEAEVERSAKVYDVAKAFHDLAVGERNRARDLNATLETALAAEKVKTAKLARMEEALIWCSGSEDFQDGGKARDGWLKLCAPLLLGAALQREG